MIHPATSKIGRITMPYAVYMGRELNAFPCCHHWIKHHVVMKSRKRLWCWSGYASTRVPKDHAAFYFRNRDDALAFSLVWSGADSAQVAAYASKHNVEIDG